MARLRRSDLAKPGWSRQRSGTGFTFRDLDGAVLAGPDRERCLALAIPPAWTQVWICPAANGHVQVVGTDAAGRRQYLYHPGWRKSRDRDKFARMLVFGEALPTARPVVAEHLALPDMPRERALAVGFRLMDRVGLRVGGETYARERGTAGVATLRREHAKTSRGQVRLRFPGKSGRAHDLTVEDPALAQAVHALLGRRSGGEELLAFRRDGQWVDLTSGDVNAYVREVMGVEVTAKDFRTWHGAVAALEHLAPESGDPSRKALKHAMRQVADHLGNTPAVARSAYVDPRIVEEFLAGSDLPAPRHGRAAKVATDAAPPWQEWEEWERALLRLLRSFEV